MCEFKRSFLGYPLPCRKRKGEHILAYSSKLQRFAFRLRLPVSRSFSIIIFHHEESILTLIPYLLCTTLSLSGSGSFYSLQSNSYRFDFGYLFHYSGVFLQSQL